MARARIAFEVSNPDAPVFVISVAAELSGMHPQTLRGYDRLGLVSPGRSGGGGRRYSVRDIDALLAIADLTSAGIGIEGVRQILALRQEATALRARIGELEAELGAATRAALPNLPVRRTVTEVTRYRPPF